MSRIFLSIKLEVWKTCHICLRMYVDVLKVLFHFHHLRSSLWTGPYILMHIKLLEIDLVNWSIIKVAIPVGSTSRDLIFMLYSSHIVYASGVSLWSMHVLRAQTLNSQYLKSQTGHTHILPLFESTIDPLLHVELSFLSLFFVKDCCKSKKLCRRFVRF